MRTGKHNPLVRENEKVKNVLYKITSARAGSATVVDARGALKGIFTDGDLRRHLNDGQNILDWKVSKVMTARPTTIEADKLAAQALEILRSKKIDEVPVIDKKRRPVGLLDVQDILRAGLA
jgi:arabinose-5-phosphate isomerase